MRVSVYKELGGTLSVLVEASRGSGKPPVLLQGVTQTSLREAVAPVILAQRGKVTPLSHLGP